MAKPNLGKLLASKAKQVSKPSAHFHGPARTRFAPSPTGTIHLGSLRTALYNYLLARATGGQFILRLEDTDRTRLKPLAERNIYDSLRWTNLQYDEGPIKQSDRKQVYHEHAQKLLETGHAYRCFCSKDRLDSLTHSARQLWPPSTASYDRKCSHLSKEESDNKAENGEQFVLRFRSPAKWPKIEDVLHGTVESLTQTNFNDPRYDDFVILKSDGMPTYHLANVVDDYMMGITHVIRGEEWLPSTPKHVSLYSALGKTPPLFIHIPLLTGEGGKKLSKRKSDQGILELAGAPHYIGPEALTNFVALLGWSPVSGKREQGSRVSEVLDLKALERLFSLDGLTKGNIQVDMGKLTYLNKQHFEKLLTNDWDEVVRRCQAAYSPLSISETSKFLAVLKNHVSSVGDYVQHLTTVFAEPEYAVPPKIPQNATNVIGDAIESINTKDWDPKVLIHDMVNKYTKSANMALRYALLGGKSGTSIEEAMLILGRDASLTRLKACLQKLQTLEITPR